MARGDMLDMLKASHGRARHIRGNGYVPPPMHDLKLRLATNSQNFDRALKTWTDSVDSYLDTKKKTVSKLEEMRKAIDEGREAGEDHDDKARGEFGQIGF